MTTDLLGKYENAFMHNVGIYAVIVIYEDKQAEIKDKQAEIKRQHDSGYGMSPPAPH